MIDNKDRRTALQAIRAVIAADCSCAPHDFLAGGVVVTPATKQPNRRRFPFPVKQLWFCSMVPVLS